MLVSTIIPVFNAAEFIDQALESVLTQDYDEHEVIVIDDGSTDDSVDRASSYDGVSVISIPHRGVGAARNTGLEAASGSLIAFLDADDIWEPGKLRTQVEFLSQNPDVDGVFGRMCNFLHQGTSRPDWLREELLTDDSPAHSLCTLLARRSVFESVGQFDSSLAVGEDSDWFFRAKDHGIRFEMMDHLFLRRRVHGRNLSHDAKAVRAGLLRVVRESLQRMKATS